MGSGLFGGGGGGSGGGGDTICCREVSMQTSLASLFFFVTLLCVCEFRRKFYRLEPHRQKQARRERKLLL